jgi:hypothetical protein
MDSKCFLYIDEYPRNAGDIPFDIEIDWGDGSGIEKYARLVVDKVPAFYHIYHNVGSLSEPFMIKVKITNQCSSAEQTVEYDPALPPLCDEEYRNSYDSLNPLNVVSRFSGIDWDIHVTSCFTRIARVDGCMETEFVTDVSINLPLIATPPVCTPLPEGAFDIVHEPVPPGEIVDDLDAHLGATANSSVVKNVEADFFYTFSPAHVDRIILTGDTAFKERVGEIRVGDLTEEVPQWVSAGGNFWRVTVPVNRAVNTLRLSLAAGESALYRRIEIYVNSAILLTEQQAVKVDVKTFLDRVPFILDLDLGQCEADSYTPWEFRDKVWQIDIPVYSSYGGQFLKIPVPYSGENNILEIDLEWELLKGYEENAPCFYLTELNETSKDISNARYSQKGTNPVNKGGRTYRLELNETTKNIAGENNLWLCAESSYYDYNAKCIVKLLGLRLVTKQYEKITAGMSGELCYRSTRSQRVCRIDIVCDANARARLQPDNYTWQKEETALLSAERGIKLIDPPGFITEHTFAFNGGTILGNLVEDGTIYAVHFYEQAPQTEYDSPIRVDFEITPERNEQEKIFYYVDAAGRYHCVSVNRIRFTEIGFARLTAYTRTIADLRLETEVGSLSCSVAGEINANGLMVS